MLRYLWAVVVDVCIYLIHVPRYRQEMATAGYLCRVELNQGGIPSHVPAVLHTAYRFLPS